MILTARLSILTCACLVLAATAACSPRPALKPDAQLMAGWQSAALDLGAVSVEIDHPADWGVTSARKEGDIPAGDFRILPPPSANGTRVNLTVFAAPKNFPNTEPALAHKLDEMILATGASMSGGKPLSRDAIMRVKAVHGGSYSVVRIDDDSVPASSQAPDVFKYLTIGVLARDGWIVNFTVFHHDAVVPQGEEILGVVRTVRMVAKE